jgi:putative transposase
LVSPCKQTKPGKDAYTHGKDNTLRVTEQFEHFLKDLKESFWGDVYGRTRVAWKKFWEAESMRERDSYMKSGWYEPVRPEKRVDYRNGFYERDYVTRLGTIRLRIARTRGQNFIPKGLEKFQRRAEDVALLIREAFLRGISTRQVGRMVAILTGEPVSAQTVSKLTRELDEAVRQFHSAELKDEWAYLFLDGVSLRMRRPGGRKRVHMLVAYGVQLDG